MKICPSCKVKIEGDLEQCPLCQNELQGEPSQAVFPSGNLLRKQSFLYKLQMLLCLAGMVVSLVLDYKMGFHRSLHWSLLVTVWVLGGQCCMRGLIRNHSNPSRIASYTGIWLTILVIPTLLLLGQKDILWWYVLPGIQILMNVLHFTFAMLDKKHNAMVYVLANALIGLLVSLIVTTNMQMHDFVWVIYGTVCLILLMAISIFKGKRARSEINKRLNF